MVKLGKLQDLGGILSHLCWADRGHPYCFNGYFDDLKEGGVDCGASRKPSRSTTPEEEDEVCLGTDYV